MVRAPILCMFLITLFFSTPIIAIDKDKIKEIALNHATPDTSRYPDGCFLNDLYKSGEIEKLLADKAKAIIEFVDNVKDNIKKDNSSKLPESCKKLLSSKETSNTLLDSLKSVTEVSKELEADKVNGKASNIESQVRTLSHALDFFEQLNVEEEGKPSCIDTLKGVVAKANGKDQKNQSEEQKESKSFLDKLAGLGNLAQGFLTGLAPAIPGALPFAVAIRVISNGAQHIGELFSGIGRVEDDAAAWINAEARRCHALNIVDAKLDQACFGDCSKEVAEVVKATSLSLECANHAVKQELFPSAHKDSGLEELLKSLKTVVTPDTNVKKAPVAKAIGNHKNDFLQLAFGDNLRIKNPRKFLNNSASKYNEDILNSCVGFTEDENLAPKRDVALAMGP